MCIFLFSLIRACLEAKWCISTKSHEVSTSRSGNCRKYYRIWDVKCNEKAVFVQVICMTFRVAVFVYKWQSVSQQMIKNIWPICPQVKATTWQKFLPALKPVIQLPVCILWSSVWMVTNVLQEYCTAWASCGRCTMLESIRLCRWVGKNGAGRMGVSWWRKGAACAPSVECLVNLHISFLTLVHNGRLKVRPI